MNLVHKQPLLAERENWVLNKLATGYIQGNRAKDAIPIYSQLLNEKKSDCESETAAISNCADVQYSLGIAKMHAGDFAGAQDSLRGAEAGYGKAEKLNNIHEFAMIQVKNAAQTELWIAVALFQLGKTPDAINSTDAALSKLARVQSDESINVGIRDDAARSLREAQTLLLRLRSAQ